MPLANGTLTKLEKDCKRAGVELPAPYNQLTKNQKANLRVKAKRILDPKWAAAKDAKSKANQKKRMADPEYRAKHNAKVNARQKAKRANNPKWAAEQDQKARERRLIKIQNNPEWYEQEKARVNERNRQRRIDNPEWAALQDLKARLKKEENLRRNLLILNFIMNGDENKPLMSRNERPFKVVTKIGNMVSTKAYMPSLHHVLYADGVSAKKETSPAAILRRKELTKANIIEFMGCIPLHSTDHDWVHRYRENCENGYLRDWSHSQWPWCLRSEENFKATCEKYDLGDLDYYQFLKDLGA